MKIGIISINMYSKYLNFACPLHTFAFQQFLLQHRFDSTVINYQPIYFNNFDMKHPYDYYSSNLLKLQAMQNKNEKKIEDYTKKASDWKEIYKEREIRYTKFQNFIDKNYKKTDFCYNSATLETMDPNFDCYICATDVIWKNEPHEGFDRGFFLGSSCMENKLKISYSASRGVNFAKTDDEKDEFFRYINDIDFISVREKSLKNYIEDNSEKEATIVLDPVLLHDKNFWNNYVVKPNETNYLFLYYVMEKATDTINEAVKYAKKHNLTIIEVTDRPLKNGRITDSDVKHKYIYDIGLEEWLGYIKYADCIFTNSFHGSCFSMIFEKNFFVGKRNGDKVQHLLEIFNLSNRYFGDDTSNLDNLSDIDYSMVNNILIKKKQISEEFIVNALKSPINQKSTNYDIYKKSQQFKMIYECKNDFNFDISKGTLTKDSNNSIKYELDKKVKNDGKYKLIENFKGWNLRVKIDKNWFYYLSDGTFADINNINKPLYVLKNKSTLPYFPVNGINTVIAEEID